MTTQDNNDIVIIKKYANRRLYNTQTSCYITLDDLFEMIKRGEEFEVKDAKTEEDLTRTVLTQIIFEQESKGYNLLPVSFLKHLISLYDNNKLGDMVPNYLEISMENFMRNQEKLHQFSQDGWGSFMPLEIFEKITKQNMDIFDHTMQMFVPKDEDR